MRGPKVLLSVGGGIALVLMAVAVVYLVQGPTLSERHSGVPATEEQSSQPVPTADQEGLSSADYPQGKAAADFVGIERWLNSEPRSLVELRGRVVLVDFWTYTCVNCLRTLPYLRDWHQKYSGNGLVMVGVHSPEFAFEKDEGNVREAVVRLGVTWPVAMDNDHATWNAYNNRWWPNKFLIDQKGIIRYNHIGEGAYLETERQIRSLLAEAGYDLTGIPVGGVDPAKEAAGPITREIYAGLGWFFGGYLGNDPQPWRDGSLQFSDPGEHQDGQYYLEGRWAAEQESLRHARSTEQFQDYIAIRYTAASLNTVMASLTATPYTVGVTLDGGSVPPELRGDDLTVDDRGATVFVVRESRMYNVIRGGSVTTHEIKLFAASDEFVLYTFTFGR